MKIFDNGRLEIYEHTGEAYEATMHYGEWRVALLNCSDFWAKVSKYERHLLTDEVFVLLEGHATLLIGDEREPVKMEKGKIYNIKRGIWHGTAVSSDAKVLIVENHNTTAENTEKIIFDEPLEVEF